MKVESKCGKILEDWNENKKRGGRGLKQTKKKIEMFYKYKTCMDKVVSEAERYNLYYVFNTEKCFFGSKNKKWMDVLLTLVCGCFYHRLGSF